MLARNHELSAFACVGVAAASAGVHPLGCITLACLGAYAGDWPDIDHESARVAQSLKWFPYRIQVVTDDVGNPRRRKPRKGERVGKLMVRKSYFPARPVWLFAAWVSGSIYDRFATQLDRHDSNRKWGPAFRVHRGFWHSIWAALITGLAWFGLVSLLGLHGPLLAALSTWFGVDTPVPVLVGETVALGMIAHIAGDACTDFGVSPLAPVLKWKGRRYPRMGLYEPLRFKVSKFVETAIVSPICLLLVVYAWAAAFLGPVRPLSGVVAFVQSLWSGLA